MVAQVPKNVALTHLACSAFSFSFRRFHWINDSMVTGVRLGFALNSALFCSISSSREDVSDLFSFTLSWRFKKTGFQSWLTDVGSNESNSKRIKSELTNLGHFLSIGIWYRVVRLGWRGLVQIRIPFFRTSVGRRNIAGSFLPNKNWVKPLVSRHLDEILD